MRRSFLIHLALASLLAIIPGIADAFNPSGLLEIHYINVGWGTSVLVIGPDGTTLLMDGGRQNMGATHVIPYMESLGLMPADGLSYMLASHQHTDHFIGLTETMNAGYDVHLAVYYNGSNYDNTYVTAFRNAAMQTTGGYHIIALGQVIQLGNGATATCVCANGTVWGHGAVPGAQNDENDRSIGLLIKYGNFEYLFAGDLGGGESDNACTGRTTDQVNVETPLAQAIMPGGEHPLLSTYGVEVLHVNHHASESSTNSDYMNLLTPRFACIAVGSGQSSGYMFPRHDVVEHVLRAGVPCVTAPPAIVLQNEEGQPAGSLTSYTGYCVGDIVIKTAGVANYIVTGTGAVTEGPDERSALGMPLTVPFDEPPSDTTAPAVVVISPNGGEQWTTFTQHNITWSAADSVGVTAYAIDYSTNAGANWTPVQSQTNGNPQVFPWSTPSTPSNNCLVRVRAWDAAGNIGNDISNSVFSIIQPADTTAPAVHVISPNGAESWSIGSLHNITWTGTDNVGVTAYRLDYSTDSGSTWILVQNWVNGNPGTYSWPIPNMPSAQALVRVSCRDAANNVGSDRSDSSFVIFDPLPVVTVTAPNGGETWNCGSVRSITWTDSDNQGVIACRVEYSTDTGSTWSSVQDWVSGDPHTYSWSVPNTPSTQARVRVSCRDASNGIGSDISDNNFTIRDATPPVVTLVSPNGEEVWDVASVHNVTWIATDNVSVAAYKLDYSTDGGTSWLVPPIQDWTSGNPGTHAWTVSITPSAQSRIRVSCRDEANNVGSDASDSNFAIYDPSPVVAVATPDGGETWDCGSVRNITWQATDNLGVTAFKLEYSTNNGSSWESPPIQDWSDGNPETYLWMIPNTSSAQCLVRVSCRDTSSGIGTDVSDGSFTIRDASPPLVTVTSPNGGEVFQLGVSISIAYDCTDNIGCAEARFEYTSDDGSDWQLMRDWGDLQPPPWMPSQQGSQYRIRVSCRDAANNVGSDISDSSFTIRDFAPPVVNVAWPNGGEALCYGEAQNITWTAFDNAGVTYYRLEYSTDSGLTWAVPPIQDWTTGNPGTHSWTAPNVPSAQYRVRVCCRDETGNVGCDISNGDFVVRDCSVPQVTVTAPNGGETWGCGTAHNIIWTDSDSSGVTSHRLEYSTDAGSTWLIVQDWVNGGPHTYSWTVPNTPSAQALVQVSCRDSTNNIVSDVSDNYFVISCAPVCNYITGDINNSGGANGIDVNYGVVYFKGGPPPPVQCDCPPNGLLYVAGDVNGNCVFNGIDIGYYVSYLQGGPALMPCPDCPPPFSAPPGPAIEPRVLPAVKSKIDAKTGD